MNFLKKCDRDTMAGAAIALAVILFLAVNVLASMTLRSARLDVTQNKLYTLSDGTREVLNSIDEPIVLRFYASRNMADAAPATGTYMNRVREFLENYVQLSGGKIQLRMYDPEPYTPEEDAAVAYGLTGVPLNDGGDMGYFGLAATNSTDDQEVIPVFDAQRERYLEYDLTKLVYNLSNPKKTVVGLMSHLPIDADPTRQQQPWAVVKQLEQFFEVKPIGRSVREIQDNIDILLIVHPRALPDTARYAIDQFVLRGGRAMVMVDPDSEEEQYMAAVMRQQMFGAASKLPGLFNAWGIDYDPTKFVGDRDAASQVEAPAKNGRTVVADYVAWMHLGPNNFSNDVVTGDLQRINVAAAGELKPKEGATTEFIPLISTGPRSMNIDVAKIMRQPDPVALLRNFEDSGERKVLAARVRGMVKTAFPDGPPEPEKKEGEPVIGGPELSAKLEKNHLSESKEPVELIVVSDVDMLADRFWIQTRDLFGTKLQIPTANNAAFVFNALDNLAGSNALIGLRSRGLSVRPFETVQEIQRNAEARYRKHEEELLTRMKDTEAKLQQMGGLDEGKEGNMVLSDKQRATIEGFRADLVQVRKELREVQHNLRKDIDDLKAWLEVLNILAVPAVISVIALVLAWMRRRRFQQRAAK